MLRPMTVSDVKLDQISLEQFHIMDYWRYVVGQYDTLTTVMTFKGFVGLKSLDSGQ